MSYDRTRLPDVASYYAAQGLRLTGRGPWRTTECTFHGGSDSMRVNVATGAFVCMAGCGARGGDVLAHFRAAHGLGFIDACKDLGAWVDDGKPYTGSTRPLQPSARALLQLASDDLYLCADVLSAVGAALVEYPIFKEVVCTLRAGHRTRPLTVADIDAFMQAAGRAIHVAGVAND